MDSTDVVNRKLGLADEPRDLVYAKFVLLRGFDGAPSNKFAVMNGENDGLKYRQIVVVERTVDEDRTLKRDRSDPGVSAQRRTEATAAAISFAVRFDGVTGDP